MKKAIATYTTVNRIMAEYQLFTKKNYGQNFIIEPSVVENIAEKSHLDQETAVIEVGPGIGALTEQLAKRAGKVVAYEIDTRLIPVLKDTLEDYSNIEILFEDFLESNLEEKVIELQKEYKKVVLAANLPYYITTPILFKLFESDADIPVITVMMQKEVADRFSATVNTKEYNALSVIVQYLYQVEVIIKVSKNVFHPKPAVDSSVVQFTKIDRKLSVSNQKEFFSFVKGAFKQRRKTILNNLKSYSNKPIEQVLNQAGIQPNRRAESLSLEEFIQLFEVYYEM